MKHYIIILKFRARFKVYDFCEGLVFGPSILLDDPLAYVVHEFLAYFHAFSILQMQVSQRSLFQRRRGSQATEYHAIVARNI